MGRLLSIFPLLLTKSFLPTKITLIEKGAEEEEYAGNRLSERRPPLRCCKVFQIGMRKVASEPEC